MLRKLFWGGDKPPSAPTHAKNETKEETVKTPKATPSSGWYIVDDASISTTLQKPKKAAGVPQFDEEQFPPLKKTEEPIKTPEPQPAGYFSWLWGNSATPVIQPPKKIEAPKVGLVASSASVHPHQAFFNELTKAGFVQKHNTWSAKSGNYFTYNSKFPGRITSAEGHSVRFQTATFFLTIGDLGNIQYALKVNGTGAIYPIKDLSEIDDNKLKNIHTQVVIPGIKAMESTVKPIQGLKM